MKINLNSTILQNTFNRLITGHTHGQMGLPSRPGGRLPLGSGPELEQGGDVQQLMAGVEPVEPAVVEAAGTVVDAAGIAVAGIAVAEAGIAVAEAVGTVVPVVVADAFVGQS